jgi:UDP-N-acetylmuramoyl-L-alanyl-D-glutamate--2,6-diaminopimelate ligase
MTDVLAHYRSDGLSLAQLLKELERADPHCDGSSLDAIVTDVTQDSRKVTPGALFVARAGANVDGARFVAEAHSQGAVAVLVGADSSLEAHGLPVVRVADVRSALALAAAAVHGHPSFGLEVIGVTGTNGKTTTTHLFRQAYDATFGRGSCGVIGTLGAYVGDGMATLTHTTPEVDDLQRVLAAMKRSGAHAVAMEVSSIAVELGRVDAVHFRAGAWLNLTRDHIDFHGSMEAYAAAKARFFRDHRPGFSVLCIDDPTVTALARELGQRGDAVITFSRRSAADALISPRSVELTTRGIRMSVDTPVGVFDVHSPLVGAHNVENLLAALGVAHALHVNLGAFAEGLRDADGAPGRLERCDGPLDDIRVFVDYAHTPDALSRVLATVSSLVTAPNRVLCVFGCGGDRDATKRAPMGEIAGRGADVAILTNDNPRTESPEAIADEVEIGLRASGHARVSLDDLARGPRGYAVELNRREAIARAIVSASKGDLVIICGKGHEDYQILGTEKIHFDDREVAREALIARRNEEAHAS